MRNQGEPRSELEILLEAARLVNGPNPPSLNELFPNAVDVASAVDPDADARWLKERVNGPKCYEVYHGNTLKGVVTLDGRDLSSSNTGVLDLSPSELRLRALLASRFGKSGNVNETSELAQPVPQNEAFRSVIAQLELGSCQGGSVAEIRGVTISGTQMRWRFSRQDNGDLIDYDAGRLGQ